MLKKTDLSNSQVVIKGKKTSSIPHDFEPVARVKQDEEKDVFFQQMGQNAQFSVERFADDESEDGYYGHDDIPSEEVLSEDDGKSVIG